MLLNPDDLSQSALGLAFPMFAAPLSAAKALGVTNDPLKDIAALMRRQTPEVPPQKAEAAPAPAPAAVAAAMPPQSVDMPYSAAAPAAGSPAVPLPAPQVVDAPPPVAMADAGQPPNAGASPSSVPPKMGIKELAAQQAASRGQAAPSLLDRVSSGLANNSEMLLALGAGFAGAPSFAEGMHRAFSGAQPFAGTNQTVNALKARGVPDDVAVAAARNPAILNQILPAVFGPKQLQWTQIGTDALGNPRYGFADLVGGRVYDANGKAIDRSAGGNAGASGIPTGPDGQPLQGQELLAHLERTDPVAAAGVKSVIAGNTIAAGRNLQKLLPLAALVEPGFSQQTYDSRKATLKDFTPSGTSGKNITAINTGLGHVDRLMGLIDDLGNYETLPMLNNPRNAIRNQFDPKYQADAARMQGTVNAVASELAKVFRSTGMSEGDINEWRAQFNVNASPTAMKAAALNALHLLDSRLEAITDSYNRGMQLSTTKPAPELLSPEARKIHEKLRAMEVAPQQTVAGAAPQAAGRPTAVGPNGQRLILSPDGKSWMPAQ